MSVLVPQNEPSSIQAALVAVMADLPAIGKGGKAAPQQGGYSYRGIEQVTKHVQGLFAKHGVVVVPAVQSIDVKDITVQNKPWTDTTLVVNYTLVGPDGSKLEATTVGIGRDNSDKGANKAMTQAFKYLLLQVLCVSDAKDDVDGATHEADAGPRRTRPQGPPEDDRPPGAATQRQVQKMAIALGALGIKDRDARLAKIGELLGRKVASSKELSQAEASQVIDALEAVDPQAEVESPPLPMEEPA